MHHDSTYGYAILTFVRQLLDSVGPQAQLWSGSLLNPRINPDF